MPKLSEDGERVAAAAETPVPERLTACGLPAALSVMESVPLRVPEAVGVKVTLMVQWAPAATDDPQLFVCAKSPLAAMLVTLRVAPPVLESVTACAALVVPTVWLVNVRVEGETPATGTLPLPLRLTVCGLPGALSLTLSVPERIPAAVGVNVTLIEQLLPAATDDPQLFVWEKSLLALMLVILSAALPLLVSVTA